MAAMASGQLPPPLSPFRSPSGIFIPVIVRAEIVDRVLRQVFVIFVPADSERLGPLFEGSSLPIGMPANLKSLIHVLRLIFRARWDILSSPRRAEAVYENPSQKRCAEIASVVLADYEQLNRDLASLNLKGDDAFHEIFDKDLWKEVDAYGEEWLKLTRSIEGKVAGQCGRARSFAHGTTKQQREMDEYQCEAVHKRGCELLCNLGAVRPRWVSGRRGVSFCMDTIGKPFLLSREA